MVHTDGVQFWGVPGDAGFVVRCVSGFELLERYSVMPGGCGSEPLFHKTKKSLKKMLASILVFCVY